MLQTSLLIMKSLNKTETPIFLSVVCSLFPKAIFLTFIIQLSLLLINKTEIPIFLICIVLIVSKGNLFDVYFEQKTFEEYSPYESM